MSSDGGYHKISAEIGGLKTAFGMMMKQWARQEEAATAGRKALHDKFEVFKDQVGLQITGLSIRVDRLTDQLAQIQPSVTTFQNKMVDDKEAALLQEGARRFRVRVGAYIVACASAVGWGVHELVTWLKHP